MSQNREGMPKINPASGWRKATVGSAVAEQHAQAGERVNIPKTRAFVAVKRVGAHIGLKAGDMMLLDTLGAFTQGQDWEEGQRPIVWASNAYLMTQTGYSLSTLKRHARRLTEIGVIAFRDSPNGKRWGRRAATGRIVEAYGFDLSPLAARAEEFEALYTHLRAERELCQRLKRQITVARRTIRARLEAAISGVLKGPWVQFTSRFEALLDHMPCRNTASEQLERCLACFRELQEQVEAAYLQAINAGNLVENTDGTEEQVSERTQKLTPRVVSSGPHILTTKQLDHVIGKFCENEEVTDDVPNAEPEERLDRALQDRGAKLLNTQTALDLTTILQACPEFTSWAHNLDGFVKDWGDLHLVAGQLRPMIGVSEQVWNLAQDRLGKQVATAALALVFEKHCAGEVASPGSYLRGMIDKAGAGALHLERSFYGRLTALAA